MKTSPTIRISIIASGLLLAACQSSTSPTGFGDLSFEELNTLSAQQATLTRTAAAMPTTGTAQYNGFANIGLHTDQDNMWTAAALGEVVVNTNFDAGTLTGTIDNFVYYDQSPISGSMVISNGIITGDTFTAQADGTVATSVLDYDIDGEFYGDNADMMSMFFDGTSTIGGVTEDNLGVGIVVK